MTYTCFYAAHPFTQPPKRYASQCFSVSQISPKVPLSMGTSASLCNPVTWTHPTQHSKQNVNPFSHFHIAHDKVLWPLIISVKSLFHKNIDGRGKRTQGTWCATKMENRSPYLQAKYVQKAIMKFDYTLQRLLCFHKILFNDGYRFHTFQQFHNCATQWAMS